MKRATITGYNIACPRCASQLYDDGQLSGNLVACPHCGQHFQMPSMDRCEPTESDQVITEFMATASEYRRSQKPHYSTRPMSEGFDWVAAGYAASVMSIVFFPACIPGLVLGGINLIRGHAGHGLIQVAIAMAIIGMIIYGLVDEARYANDLNSRNSVFGPVQGRLEAAAGAEFVNV